MSLLLSCLFMIIILFRSYSSQEFQEESVCSGISRLQYKVKSTSAQFRDRLQISLIILSEFERIN